MSSSPPSQIPPTQIPTSQSPTSQIPPAVNTQTALLDAAEGLFSERGFGGVSTREIVERAGANIAAIKYHFGSKEGLYRAVLKRAMARPECDLIWDELPKAGETITPAQAAGSLARFIGGFLEHIIHEASSDTAPSLLCREAFDPSEAFAEFVDGYIRPRIERIESAIGVLMPDASDAELRASGQGILGMVLHYKSFYELQARLWLGREPDAARVEVITSTLVRFTLRGLGCDAAMVGAALEEAISQRETTG